MAEPTKFIATHTVQPNETLSDLALKYYGSASREKWMIIYEANKGVIGDNPGLLKPGWVLKIPAETQEPAASKSSASRAGRPRHIEE